VGINGLQPHIRARKHLVMRPQSLTDNNPPFLPSQIAKAYGAQSLYNANVNGAGQSIAIVIDTFPNTSDLTSFWQTYGVNQSINNIQFIQVVPGTLPTPSGEESLDVEWSSSIAPGAKVRVYATTDLSDANLDQAYQQVFEDVTNHPEYGIHQMSLSFGLGELYSTPAQVSTDSQYFANLTAAGVTIFVSSGDGGSTPGLGPAGDTSGPTQVETPASDPSVTAVGGTSLTLDQNGVISSETAWSLSGGGVSVFFNRPTWQVGTGVPAGTTRAVPDVASVADPSTAGVVTLNGAQTSFGGTSWSAPTWAGFAAVLNQARAGVHLPPLGLLGPKIYPLLGSGNFGDIITGSNGFSAGPGYDEVTGIGSPVTQMISQTLIGVQTAPLGQTLPPGQDAVFTVASAGTAVGYQWQRLPAGGSVWNNLTDNSSYAGSTTTTLTVHGSTLANSGDQFRCVVNTGSSMITSAPPSTLVVDTPLVVTTLAGQVLMIGAQDGSGPAAQFSYPSGVAVDSARNLYIADFNNDTIRKVTPTGVVSTPYGSAGVIGSTDATGTHATFNTPNAVAIDAAGNLYVADSGNSTIRKITPAGVVSTLAGRAGFTGTRDDPNGLLARFNQPQGIAVDHAGNVYVADTFNYTIRKITPSGSVSTLAGTAGMNGFADGLGTAAMFAGPFSLAADSQGNVYVADLYNYAVRKIAPDGTVTTPYGQPGMPGRTDGLGTMALFNAPMGIAVDAADNVYVCDSQIPPTIDSQSSGNNTLRRITSAGVVSTIAGTPGVTGSSDGMGAGAQFYSLQAVTIDSVGVVYFADTFNQTVRAGAATPQFIAQPSSVTLVEGQGTTFSTAVAGLLTPVFQWQRMPVGGSTWSNMSDVVGAYSGTGTQTLSLADATLAMNGDQFQCIVSRASLPVLTSNDALLTVQTAYAHWASTFFSAPDLANPAVSGPSAAPLNDGVPNLLKCIFDINPTVTMTPASLAALPTSGVETDSGTQYLTLTYRQNQALGSIVLAVQTSTDLIHWQTVTPSSTQTIGTDQATGDPIVQVKVQTQNATGMFIRLQGTSS
jgi:hypothetical protein